MDQCHRNLSASRHGRGVTTRVVPERIRLLKFAAQIGRGGTERQFLNLGLALDAQRFALEYSCMRRWGRPLGELPKAGILLREYPIRSLCSIGAIWQQLLLARHISQRAIQIVHSYNFCGNLFAIPAAWLAGAPVIVASIRDCGVYLSTAHRHVQRYICRLADCILVNAESVKEWLIGDGYNPSNIVVIRNGIDLARFDEPRRAGLRQELGIPEHAPIVTMPGRLNPRRGVEDFIDAAAILSWQLPEVRFLVVGEGHVFNGGTLPQDHFYRREIAERADRLGLRRRVILMGYRADVRDILSETSVSVLPSATVGLSKALLESMAAGVPVVATRVGGTTEAIDHGVTGLLVPPNDPQELATSIGRLLMDRDFATMVGAAGRQVAHERFGRDRMVQATEQLYLDLLVRKAAAPGWRCRLGLARPAFPTWAGRHH